jgi:hypothetical protein
MCQIDTIYLLQGGADKWYMRSDQAAAAPDQYQLALPPNSSEPRQFVDSRNKNCQIPHLVSPWPQNFNNFLQNEWASDEALTDNTQTTHGRLPDLFPSQHFEIY